MLIMKYFSSTKLNRPSFSQAEGSEELLKSCLAGVNLSALASATVLCLSVLLTSGPSLSQEARAQRGLLFVQTNCASCHAVRRTDVSPLTIAPPFRDLHRRYPVADLEESFSEGIVTGHPTMPQFKLDAAQIADVIAYLHTLER